MTNDKPKASDNDKPNTPTSTEFNHKTNTDNTENTVSPDKPITVSSEFIKQADPAQSSTPMATTTPKPSTRKIYDFRVDQIKDHTSQIRELFLTVTNSDEFQFKAGQFVMLNVPTAEGKPALRAYSIATTEHNKKGFRLIFKFVENGVASNFVWRLKGQETLKMTGPFGKVFFQEPPTEQIVFLNTGSGLSQHFCFLESKMQQYPNLKYKLFFGVRRESDIYYQKELDELKKNLPHFEYHYVLSRPSDNWQGKRGYVQNFLSETNYKNIPTTFYLCGNSAMIKDVKRQLIELDGIDKSKIWAEAFD